MVTEYDPEDDRDLTEEEEFLEPVSIDSTSGVKVPPENPEAWHICRDFIDPLADELEKWNRKPKEHWDDLDELEGIEMRLYGMGYPDEVAAFDRAMAWLHVRRLDNIRTSIRRRTRNVSKKSRDLKCRLVSDSGIAADSWRSQFSGFEHSVVEPFIRYLRNLGLELESQFAYPVPSSDAHDTHALLAGRRKPKTPCAEEEPKKRRGPKPNPLTKQRAKFTQALRKKELTYSAILEKYLRRHRSDSQVTEDILRLARRRVYGPENETDEPSGGQK